MFVAHTRRPLAFFTTVVAILAAGSALPARAAVGRANFLSDNEQQFVNRAWDLNHEQIVLGKNVEHQAANPDVKAFGERMVAYHNIIGGDLKALTLQYRGTVPDQLGTEARQVADRLAGLSGADFDRAYMRATIDALTQSISLFVRQANDVAQTPLDNWAGGVVPELRRELQAAQQLAREVGVPDDGAAITASHNEPANRVH